MRSRRPSPNDEIKPKSAESRWYHDRMSLESSFRGHRAYALEHRDFRERRLGRGPGKHHPPQPQSLPRVDIFMEAGRLAAEYLVCQGLLPPSLLTIKRQNGNLKGQTRDLRGFGLADRDDGPLPPSEGRTSALARLGKLIPDRTTRRGRSLDEYSPPKQRSHIKRKSTRSRRDYDIDWNRDDRRNCSFKERARASSSDMEQNEDGCGGGYLGKQRDSDFSIRASNIRTGEPLTTKAEISGNLEPMQDNIRLPIDADFEYGSKRNSSSKRHIVMNRGHDDASISFSDANSENLGYLKTEEIKTPGELGRKHSSLKNFDMSNKHAGDSLDLCRSPGVSSTETDPSLATTVRKVDQGPFTEVGKIRDVAQPGASEPSMGKSFVTGSQSNFPANVTRSLKSLRSEISSSRSLDTAAESQDFETKIAVKNEMCHRSQSFSGRTSFICEQEKSQSHGLDSCRSMDEPDENLAHCVGVRNATKRSRDWPSCSFSEPGESLCFQNLRAKQICMQVEETPVAVEIFNAVNKVKLEEGNLSLDSKDGSGVRSIEEKHGCSSKTFVLNLIDASEISESYESLNENHIPMGSSAPDAEKQVLAELGRPILKGNFESDFFQEVSKKTVVEADIGTNNASSASDFIHSEKKDEPMYSSSSTRGFLTPAKNVVDQSGVQDSCSLGLSELFVTDFSNCSSLLPSSVNGLQNGISLHGQEDILRHDDQLLSLGEIATSFIGWDQPNPDYGKLS